VQLGQARGAVQVAQRGGADARQVAGVQRAREAALGRADLLVEPHGAGLAAGGCGQRAGGQQDRRDGARIGHGVLLHERPSRLGATGRAVHPVCARPAA
jgi:hypothetical protein